MHGNSDIKYRSHSVNRTRATGRPVFYSFQTGWDQPSLLINGYWGKGRQNLELITRFCIVPKLRRMVYIPTFPHTPAWRGIDALYFVR